MDVDVAWAWGDGTGVGCGCCALRWCDVLEGFLLLCCFGLGARGALCVRLGGWYVGLVIGDLALA